jgi:hypothetical protein
MFPEVDSFSEPVVLVPAHCPLIDLDLARKQTLSESFRTAVVAKHSSSKRNPDRTVSATGYAWCADDRQQWQIPVLIHFSLSENQDGGIKFLRIRIGDARLETLAAHRDRRASIEPGEWLLEFDVAFRGN